MNKALTDLMAFQKGFSLAMEIFKISKRFPKEERYSLTDQIRRSSRAVCSNLGDVEYKILVEKSKEIGKLLDYYMHNPAKFRRNSDK